MHPDGRLDVVAPVPIGRDLEFFSLEGDAVVTADAPIVLFAQDVVEVGDDTLDESRPLFQRRLAKFGVVGGKVGLPEVPVGFLHVGDAVKSQFLGEPVLVGSEGSLDASPGLGGVGGDHLDAQLLHRAAELGEEVLVDPFARLGGVPVVASAVGVKGAEQPFGSNDLADPPEAALGAFLVDEEHRVMLIGRVVHGEDEIPLLSGDPLVGASVLMEHQAGPGSSLPSLPVDAAPGRFFDQPGLLEAGLEPRIAAGPPKALVPGVEMLRGPSVMAGPIPFGQCQDLVHRRLVMRYLGQTLVDESLQPSVVVPLDIAAKRAVENPQDPRCFLLAEPSFPPAAVSFSESLHPDLLQPLRRSHGHLHGEHENRTDRVLQDRTNHKLLTEDEDVARGHSVWDINRIIRGETDRPFCRTLECLRCRRHPVSGARGVHNPQPFGDSPYFPILTGIRGYLHTGTK